MAQEERPQRQPGRITRRLHSMFTTEQFTYAELRRMFVPLLLDQLFIFFIGMLSTAMVSSSGEAAISAVSMVSSLAYIATSLFNGISTGGTILVAQARGSGDDRRVRLVIGQTIFATTLTALLTCVFFVAFAEPLVRTLYPKAEPLLISYSIEYLRLMSWSYIPFALFNAIFSVFRGLGDSKSSLALTITINSVHLLLSFLLINVLDLGVTGSGLSYLYARIIGAVVAVVWMFWLRRDLGMHIRYIFRLSKSILSSIIKLGIPLAIEQVLFQAGMLLTQVYIAFLPTATIAANGIAGSVFGLLNAVAFSLTTIVTTVCGQCIGAKRFALAEVYCRQFIKAGRFLLLIAVLIFAPFTPLLLRLYAPTAEALPQIYLALAIAAIPMPLIWGDANIPGAAMRAAGDATYVTMVSLVAMWVARVGIGYVLTIPLGLDIGGVWLGLVLEWVIRVVLLRPRLQSGKWLAKVQAQ